MSNIRTLNYEEQPFTVFGKLCFLLEQENPSDRDCAECGYDCFLSDIGVPQIGNHCIFIVTVKSSFSGMTSYQLLCVLDNENVILK